MPPIPRLAAAFAALSAVSGALAQTYTPMADIPGSGLMQRMQSAIGGIGAGGEVADAKWNLVAGELWIKTGGEKGAWKTVSLGNGKTADADGGAPPRARPAVHHRRQP